MKTKITFLVLIISLLKHAISQNFDSVIQNENISPIEYQIRAIKKIEDTDAETLKTGILNKLRAKEAFKVVDTFKDRDAEDLKEQLIKDMTYMNTEDFQLRHMAHSLKESKIKDCEDLSVFDKQCLNMEKPNYGFKPKIEIDFHKLPRR